jgi:hypothetical protein
MKRPWPRWATAPQELKQKKLHLLNQRSLGDTKKNISYLLAIFQAVSITRIAASCS